MFSESAAGKIKIFAKTANASVECDLVLMSPVCSMHALKRPFFPNMSHS